MRSRTGIEAVDIDDFQEVNLLETSPRSIDQMVGDANVRQTLPKLSPVTFLTPAHLSASRRQLWKLRTPSGSRMKVLHSDKFLLEQTRTQMS